MKNEEDVQEYLMALLAESFEGNIDVPGLPDVKGQGVTSFESAGVLTRNKGMVVRLEDGSEFQVAIVRSK
jgi:hypothetical protein